MCRSSPLLARSASTLTCNVTSLDSASTNFDLETTPVKLWSNNVEDQRALKTFTEETRRFRVPVIGRSQEELDLVTTDNNDVHVLTQNPFGVHTFTSVARNQEKTDHSEHRFTNLHSLVPFGTPVAWLGCLPSNDLICFSPEMGCLLRLDPEAKLGSLHFVDEKSNKQRGRQYQYGFSYFGGSRGGEGRTASEWGVTHDMASSHGRVLVWRKGPGLTEVSMFQFPNIGLDVEKQEDEVQVEQAGLRVDMTLPNLHEEDGIESISCPSHNVWTVKTMHGKHLVVCLGASLRDPVSVRSVVSDEEEDVLNNNNVTFQGRYTMSKGAPFLPPPHLSFDPTARYGQHTEHAYYSTVIGQPSDVGSTMSVYASLRSGDDDSGDGNASGDNSSDDNSSDDNSSNDNSSDDSNRVKASRQQDGLPQENEIMSWKDYGACDGDPRNQSPAYGARFTTTTMRTENHDGLTNVVHRPALNFFNKRTEKEDHEEDHIEPHLLVPLIEVVDTNDDVVRTIDASLPLDALYQATGSITLAESKRSIAELRYPPIVGIDELISSGEIVTLQAGGWIRTWDVNEERLREDLSVWKDMHGRPRATFESGSLGITGTNDNGEERRGLSNPEIRKTAPELEMPKHGKETDGKQHVGGNTWAGGSGGSNTAGLGGRGGPYRLDGGHEVHQVSEELKNEVSEEAKAKARDMAEEAFQQRLNDINLGTAENDAYENYFGKVSRQVTEMQSVLENVQARAKERSWLKHTTFGELDDSKIVDGAAGERNVYKRRGSENVTPGTQLKKPKQLRFVFDVSGSMYRFNGQDGRLDRLLETAVMVMSALDGMSTRFQYSIVGHSGDGPNVPFVASGQPPKNRGEQLKVLQRMVAHTQFCMSGDSTLEAAEHAIDEVSQTDSDEAFVFLVSDANLRRYGISPHELGIVLTSNDQVNACAIFIASLADEAASIEEALPAGTGHICFDTSGLPDLFRNLFAASFAEDL